MHWAGVAQDVERFLDGRMANIDFIDVANKTAGLDPMPPSLTFAAMYDPSLAEEAMKRL